MIDAAQYMGVRPVFHLSNLDDTEGAFSQDLAHIALTDQQVQTRLIHEVLGTLHSLGYQDRMWTLKMWPAQDAQFGLCPVFTAASVKPYLRTTSLS